MEQAKNFEKCIEIGRGAEKEHWPLDGSDGQPRFDGRRQWDVTEARWIIGHRIWQIGRQRSDLGDYRKQRGTNER